MKSRGKRGICVVAFMGLLFALATFILPLPVEAQGSMVKISVFNFGVLNIDASGYGTTVSNMLINSLSADPALVILDRKELESFLSMNDLQQNDDLNNMANIGSRLGLDMVVAGTVEKRGPVINIRSHVVQVERRRSIHRSRVSALGDAGLMTEIRKLSEEIRKAVKDSMAHRHEEDRSAIKAPTNIQKRAGSKRVSLFWSIPEGNVAGFEIFRATVGTGPFSRIAQVSKPEFTDEDVERNKTYYYRVRAFDSRGLHSPYSPVVAAETALTPNPPVILSAEGHIRSITLTWSPNPISSEDPLKLKGYRVYRAKVEGGPYKEIANILGSDLGLGLDTALDKILKVPYQDRDLADGEEYFYRVTAYNEKGLESDYSKTMKGTTIPAVNGLNARGDMVREIELSWNNLDFFSIRGYYVYRSMSPDGGFLKIKRVDAPPPDEKRVRYVDTEGLGDAIRYYYRVTAYEDPNMETSPSVAVSALTKGKPPLVEKLTAKSGLVKKVELRWEPQMSPDVEGYILYRSLEKAGRFEQLKKIRGRNANTYIDDGEGMGPLRDGVTYYYVITTYNKVDVESNHSPVAEAMTKPRPSKPAGLQGQGNKARKIPLNWLANREKDIAAYRIYRSEDPVGEQFSELARVVGKNSYEDEKLKDGHTYRYRIQAEDVDGLLSHFSDVVSLTTKPRPRPPRDVYGASRGDGSVEITWKEGSERDIVGYNIYEKGFFRAEPITRHVKSTSFIDARPLKKGKERVYMVTVVDADGLESDFSPELTVVGR